MRLGKSIRMKMVKTTMCFPDDYFGHFFFLGGGGGGGGLMLTPQSKAMVKSGWSVHLNHTFFLGKLA